MTVVSQTLFVALLGVLLCGPACSKSDTAQNANDTPPSAANKPRRAASVAAVPLGAPASGDLLGFSQDPPGFFDWRKTPVWAELAQSRFRLPRATRRDVARILSKGWSDPGASNLVTFLKAQARPLARAAKLPPCAPLRKTWTHTELLLEHRSLFTLKALGESLLLRARHHQHEGRPGRALEATLAALRLSCHMSHVPEVLMQYMALRAEQQALQVLANLGATPAGCKAVQGALAAVANRRAPLAHIARSDWLMARSHLRLITGDLTKAGPTGAQTRKRLLTLMRLIQARTSDRYQRYSLLLRQSLTTGLDSDWQKLDIFLGTLEAGLTELKKKHGAKSGFDLSRIVSQLPNKRAAWSADIISRVFMGLVSLRSATWKRARRLYHANRETVAKLRKRRCP